jgi:hypothetical protein
MFLEALILVLALGSGLTPSLYLAYVGLFSGRRTQSRIRRVLTLLFMIPFWLAYLGATFLTIPPEEPNDIHLKNPTDSKMMVAVFRDVRNEYQVALPVGPPATPPLIFVPAGEERQIQIEGNNRRRNIGVVAFKYRGSFDPVRFAWLATKDVDENRFASFALHTDPAEIQVVPEAPDIANYQVRGIVFPMTILAEAFFTSVCLLIAVWNKYRPPKLPEHIVRRQRRPPTDWRLPLTIILIAMAAFACWQLWQYAVPLIQFETARFDLSVIPNQPPPVPPPGG